MRLCLAGIVREGAFMSGLDCRTAVGFRIVCLCLVMLTAALAYGQTPPALSFEVASIKPAPPLNPVQIAQTGKLPNVGMNVKGSMVDIGYLSLSELLALAFNVKSFQISGPDWMSAQRFDILARMPEGATKEQVPQMLQALLAERFQLKFHRENRENSVYALVVAKGGHKLKESTAEAEPAAKSEEDNKETVTVNGTQLRVDPKGGGATVTSPEFGAMKMSMSPDGQMRMEFTKVSMQQFADMVGRFVDKPVVDMTEIQGNYGAV